MESYTEDTIFAGAVRVLQPRRGYRFSVDSLLLADFAARARFESALDLGCGSGVVAFALAHRFVRARVVGIELDGELATLAEMGAERNGFESRVRIVQGDLRRCEKLIERQSVDLVVCNPPYHDPHAGQLSPEVSRARARHQLSCRIEDVFRAATIAAQARGRLVLIIPCESLSSVVGATPRGFCLAVLRYVHPRADRPARRVLMEWRRGGRQVLSVLPPLFVHEGAGYSGEVRKLLGEATDS